MTVLLALTWLGCAPASSAQSLEDEIRVEVARYVKAVNAGDTVRMTVDSVSVQPRGQDTAIAVFRFRAVRGVNRPQVETGTMTLVYRRTPAGWRIADDHTSSLAKETVETAKSGLALDAGPTAPVRETGACVVTRIVDGDTVECRGAGRVRLIGMDTPELAQEPFGRRAAQALAELIPVGTRVRLERDVEPRDRYGRLLAYVWTDSLMVNWAMVRLGWAVTLTYPPNVQYVEWFTAAQQLAREGREGLWAVDAFECLPRDHRRGRCE